MRAVILAAGMGRRLGAAEPKPLVEIAPGITLLSNQIDILSRLLDRDRIMLVVGHRAPEILNAHPELAHVVNSRFATTNTARSLHRALLETEGDVLWTNADLFFEQEAAARLIDSASEHSRCLVNRLATGPEEIKYRLGEDGLIVELSKQVAAPAGEALGMNIVRANDRPALLRALQSASDSDYFEKALENCALGGSVRFAPVDVGGAFCKEVDFPEDLAIVRSFVRERRA